MHNILIAPRFLELGGLHRAYATNTIALHVQQHGCHPVMPFYSTSAASIEQGREIVMNMMDTQEYHGIILQGGNDISPILYGQEAHAAQGEQLYRDVVEYALVEYAYRQNIPLFGICRGLQMINVGLGGTLHQHLHEQEWLSHITTVDNRFEEKDLDSIQHTEHDVHIVPGGCFAPLFIQQDQKIAVNSYHHQGIEQLAGGLQVEARSSDGLVEAVSAKDGAIIGVQWHPELHWETPAFARPFAFWIEKIKL